MEVGILEAKTRFSELAERASRGEEITVTRRGKPLIKLVPASRRMDKDELVAWLSRTAKNSARMKPSTTEENLADRHAGHKY